MRSQIETTESESPASGLLKQQRSKISYYDNSQEKDKDARKSSPASGCLLQKDSDVVKSSPASGSYPQFNGCSLATPSTTNVGSIFPASGLSSQNSVAVPPVPAVRPVPADPWEEIPREMLLADNQKLKERISQLEKIVNEMKVGPPIPDDPWQDTIGEKDPPLGVKDPPIPEDP